ncbi:MAG: hypothetical protein MJ252_21115 [archaeon]|nr:hypothetical protein [archaeon]
MFRKFSERKKYNLEHTVTQSSYTTQYSNNSKASRNSGDLKRNYSYNLICRSCYSFKNQRERGQKDLELYENPDKDRLIKSFVRENPSGFKDKMDKYSNNRINDKIKQRLYRTKSASDFLENYKTENPSKKEQLQRTNESNGGGIFTNYGGKDPRYLKQKARYDEKEKNFLQNSYNVGEPRKAIKDYFDKTVFNPPVTEEVYKASPILQENYLNDLKDQIEDKKKRNQKLMDDDLENEKAYNKNLEAVRQMEREQEREKRELNKLMNQENLRNAEQKKKEQKREREDQKVNKLIAEENLKNQDINDRIYDEQKKEDEKKLLNRWKAYDDEVRKNKKAEEEKDTEKWSKMADEITVNCQHGHDIYKCAICKRYFPKTNMVKLRKNKNGNKRKTNFNE